MCLAQSRISAILARRNVQFSELGSTVYAELHEHSRLRAWVHQARRRTEASEAARSEDVHCEVLQQLSYKANMAGRAVLAAARSSQNTMPGRPSWRGSLQSLRGSAVECHCDAFTSILASMAKRAVQAVVRSSLSSRRCARWQAGMWRRRVSAWACAGMLCWKTPAQQATPRSCATVLGASSAYK